MFVSVTLWISIYLYPPNWAYNVDITNANITRMRNSYDRLDVVPKFMKWGFSSYRVDPKVIKASCEIEISFEF